MDTYHTFTKEDLQRLKNELQNVSFKEEEKIDKTLSYYGFEKINNVINTSDTSRFSDDVTVRLSDFHLKKDDIEFLFTIEQDDSFALLARDKNDDFQTVLEKQTFYTVQMDNKSIERWDSHRVIKEAVSSVESMNEFGGFGDKEIFENAFESDQVGASIEFLQNYTSYEIKVDDNHEEEDLSSDTQIINDHIVEISLDKEVSLEQSAAEHKAACGLSQEEIQATIYDTKEVDVGLEVK
jgi:hypothetical protein